MSFSCLHYEFFSRFVYRSKTDCVVFAFKPPLDLGHHDQCREPVIINLGVRFDSRMTFDKWSDSIGYASFLQLSLLAKKMAFGVLV